MEKFRSHIFGVTDMNVTGDIYIDGIRVITQHMAETVLTNTQVMALSASPIELIPAIADATIQVMDISFTIDAVAGAYSVVPSGLYLRYVGAADDLLMNVSLESVVDSSAYLIASFVNYTNGKTLSPLTGVELTASGLFTGGHADNTMTVRMVYKVIEPWGWLTANP